MKSRLGYLPGKSLMPARLAQSMLAATTCAETARPGAGRPAGGTALVASGSAGAALATPVRAVPLAIRRGRNAA